jgi:hypothetical protein
MEKSANRLRTVLMLKDSLRKPDHRQEVDQPLNKKQTRLFNVDLGS